jgi:hypothetical protein
LLRLSGLFMYRSCPLRNRRRLFWGRGRRWYRLRLLLQRCLVIWDRLPGSICLMV